MTPSRTTIDNLTRSLVSRWPSTSDSSARMPPSPSLSARRTNVTYFTEISTISAQKVSDTIPSTSVVPGAWPVALSAVENV